MNINYYYCYKSICSWIFLNKLDLSVIYKTSSFDISPACDSMSCSPAIARVEKSLDQKFPIENLDLKSEIPCDSISGGVHFFNINELRTTLAELNAIAKPASIGGRVMPQGMSTPIAIGIMNIL
ncbi:hypothetical protein WN66_01343 [Saccharomyces cerevisiae]|nr:hypothetical protein WN66_01343 [Saccharomyces cerevisiae]